MKWVTRERARVDRIACPWLITRFIDPQPEFLFVPAAKVLETAAPEPAVEVVVGTAMTAGAAAAASACPGGCAGMNTAGRNSAGRKTSGP